MRVLTVGNMYPPHHLGGYELTWQSSVGHLRARGHTVRVLTTDWRAGRVDEPDEPDVYRELRWYWHDHRFPRMTPFKAHRIERHNAVAMHHHLRELAPDAVCWWAMGGMSISLIEQVRSAAIPAAGVVGDDWMSYGEAVDVWRRWRRRLGSSPVHLDHVEWLFNSERTLREARRANGALPRSVVANPGIDASLFPRAPERPRWEWRMAYVGRIDPRKGVRLAVEALKHLPLEASLRVVGGGDEGELHALKQLAGRLGVNDRVTFERVPRSDLASVYGDADVVLFPVLWEEPWGLVPLEAMAVGRPVVASGRGGAAEYLRDGRNAVLFSPDAGPEGLAEGARRIAEDPDLRRRLRAGGFETAAAFTEAAYNQAIEQGLRRAIQAAH